MPLRLVFYIVLKILFSMKIFVVLVVSFVVLLLSLVFFFASLARDEWKHDILCAFLFVVAFSFFQASIDAVRYDNEEYKAYKFPASTYKLETRVEENITYSVRDGAVTKNVVMDTLYVLSGVEPMMFRHDSEKELMETKIYYLAK